MLNKKLNTSWGGVADWYNELLEKEGTYQKEVILPNLLRVMTTPGPSFVRRGGASVSPTAHTPQPPSQGGVNGETILDIGCGTGFFARAFAKEGARVVGVDVGRELIEKAREGERIKNQELGIKDGNLTRPAKADLSLERRGGDRPVYRVASADDMPMVENDSMDKAVMVLSLQNIENAAGALKEASRVLKKGGKLFLVFNHPAFRIPQASSWGWDAGERIKNQESGIRNVRTMENGIQYRRLDAYMSERKVKMQMHPGSDPTDITWSFHRPLQYYFKLFFKNNLAVTRLEEWTSHTKTPHGPRAAAENRARAEFPLFLCLEAEKR